ncbi:hypothetical protein [Parachryseolinea silvisoli]|uniref:hypothetical protein n=1 Tax=Parachryseolinea silvisoli TaxID=2873601 RepID=UPI002265A153|nr:hypothetical protein [Parachryseolinea silvisoli]MCD9017460.1 hypothetical protein [Parachryseolinea silvisoli]
MKGKGILLLVALVLPTCIFVFLKFFGKNEFAVEPLYQVAPKEGVAAECGALNFPYQVPDSVLKKYVQMGKDSMVLLAVGELNKESDTQLKRVEEEFGDISFIRRLMTNQAPLNRTLRKCVFLLPESSNLVLIDKEGTIRGQYNASDREDVDRMLTELTIIFKKY